MSELWGLLWKWRRRLVLVWVVVMAIALVRVITADDVYTSSSLLTPLPLEQVEEQMQGGIGVPSVRSLLNVGSRRDDYAVAAFLQSRQLHDAVIEELDLAKELFPDRWDADRGQWIEARGGAPSPGRARQRFAEHVDTDYEEFTGLLSIAVHWTDPESAYRISQAIVEVADRMLRDSAIDEGERRVAELAREMDRAIVSDVRTYLADEMTRAISSLTSIRARARYAFRVIDPPVVPDRPSWPPRFLLLLLAALATAVVEMGVVAGVHLRRHGPNDT